MKRWVLALILLVAVSAAVEAKFAMGSQFSGRGQDTCTLCHAPAALIPEATAHLTGAPDQWLPGETYTLKAAVTGGPERPPEPFAQGGFMLEVEAGILDEGPGMDDAIRIPRPTVAAYEPEGALLREWQIDWTAPGLDAPPGPITLWLAVVAPNGEHHVFLNESANDAAAQNDATANLAITIPADPGVVLAWQAMPLARPIFDNVTQTEHQVIIEGHHADGNATAIAHRSNGGPWLTHETGREFRFVFTDPAGLLEFRSEGSGRVSPTIHHTVARESIPAAPSVAILALIGAFCLRRCHQI